MKENVMKDKDYVFKKGTYQLHPNANFNFQMNRMVMWSGADLEEVKEAAQKITDLGSWVSTFLALGETALSEGRTENAIAYFRGAGFFIYTDLGEKERVAERANSLFYDHYSHIFKDGLISRDNIPYEQGYLPVWVARPDENKVAGTILLHGGFDSDKEEFLGLILYLKQKGYIVYLFEGPGQGEVLRKHRIPLTHEWEKPVKAIIDHYELDDVTLVGLSLGGMLAPRAAAFEPRIKRVVAWGVMPNFLEVGTSTRPQVLRMLTKVLLRLGLERPLNQAAESEMAKDPLAEWGIRHGMYVFGVESPYDYLKVANKFQMVDIGDRITQDFLQLDSSKDHFIPRGFYKPVIDSLINVKSLTFRLFTEREEAENHCSAGNTQLALDTIVDWIAEKSR